MTQSTRGRIPEHIRRHNLGVVLRAIRQGSSIPRHELAKITNLTKTSISDIVNELLACGLVTEDGETIGSRRGGRRPIVLRIATGTTVAVGVDIRRNTIYSVLLDLNGKILQRKTACIPGGASSDVFFRTLHQCVSQTIGRKSGKRNVLGIGVGAPGPLDLDRGRILNLPDFRSLQNVNLKESLQRRFRVPVFVQGGAVAGAVGEYFHRKNSARGVPDLAFIEVDLGLGFGYILDDRIVRGPSSAGEIGHTVVQADGRMCSCGRRGCLYQYGSGLAILKNLGRVRTVKTTGVHRLDERLNYTQMLEEIIATAKEGDSRSVKAFEEAARYLGASIVNVFNLLSPSLLVIGSSIPELVDLLWPILLASVEEDKNLEGNIRDRIQLPSYGTDAIAAGGAYAVLNALYEDPRKAMGRVVI